MVEPRKTKLGAKAATASRRVPRERPKPWPAHWAWAWLTLPLALMLYVSWRLIELPLNRDEGEFAYIAQQILAGVPPYASGYAMKWPGIYVAYATLLYCFGDSLWGIHIGAALVNCASIGTLFLVTRRLFGSMTGAAAAALFTLLMLDSDINGITAQAEIFVIFPVLCGILALLTAHGETEAQAPAAARPNLWLLMLAGLCFGMAAIIKQHGVAFSLFAIWYVVNRWWQLGSNKSPGALVKPLIALCCGGFLPVLITITALQATGVLGAFRFWTITYARTYVSQIPLTEGLTNISTSLMRFSASMPSIWVLALLGASSLWWDKSLRTHRATVLALLASSLLATCPGFYFRPHYFVFILPAVAILGALGCRAVGRLAALACNLDLATEWPAAIVLTATVVSAITLVGNREYLFFESPLAISRRVYGNNPFPEAVEIASYIAAHSKHAESIMVLGSEPEIYFYAHRRAASPHVYMYPLMEVHPFSLQMQRDLAADVEKNRPEWVVWESVGSAWVVRPNSEGWMFDWMQQCLDRDYDRVGVVDIVGPNRTNFVWGAEAKSYQPKSKSWLAVLHRKNQPVALDPPR